MKKRQSQHGLSWSPYLTLDLSLCYVIIVCVCDLFTLCAGVMFLSPVCVMYTCSSMLCVGCSLLCVAFSLCDVRLLVCVICAVCSHEPCRFAPSMPRFAHVARFARCGRLAPAGPASNRKLPCCECRFWNLTFAPRSYIYIYIYICIW